MMKGATLPSVIIRSAVSAARAQLDGLRAVLRVEHGIARRAARVAGREIDLYLARVATGQLQFFETAA